MYYFTTLMCTILVCIAASPASLKFRPEAGEDKLVQQLYEQTSLTQVLKEVKYKEFFTWHKTRGVYHSEVKLNFHGGPAFNQLRKVFKVFDNNMFATAWVTTNLLEAYKYGGAPKPTQEQIDLALEAINKHKDRNTPGTTSNLVFWPQVYNETLDYWGTRPENLLHLMDSTDHLPAGFIEALLKKLGLKELAEDIDELLKSKNEYRKAFRVPPDFDDTYVNMGLGALLYDMKTEFQSSWNVWNFANTNISSAIHALKEFAYRPFSSNRDSNTIDPRTYYYLRGFLDRANENGEDIALSTTWMESLNETRKLYIHGNPMPFNINNVDITVAADVVAGLTSAVLTGLIEPRVLEDPDVAQIYLNTSSLLAYEIANNLTSRPDLALTYYPSIVEYYWFVARIVNVMETKLLKGPLPCKVMQQVYTILKKACLGPMTKDIVTKAQNGTNEKYFFDDFLGNADTNIFNQTQNDYEDRIFTTAMAGNALLYTWTVFDENSKKNHWRKDTPDNVKRLTTGIVRWLREHTLCGNYKPWNAFFSGSVKGFEALPFWYPANRFEFLNGTAIKDWTKIPRAGSFYGVEGYIPQAEYNAMIEQKHFGVPTPTVFKGYNAGNGYFPFWSSSSYTYSCALLAVARFENTFE